MTIRNKSTGTRYSGISDLYVLLYTGAGDGKQNDDDDDNDDDLCQVCQQACFI